MKCENLQFNLPFYAEDVLTDAERENLDAHLERCPVCRAKSAELQILRNDLRSLPRFDAPPDLLYSVKNAISGELKKSQPQSVPVLSAEFLRWLQYRVMPYAVGTLASLLITFALLTTLLSTRKAAATGVELARADSNRFSTVTISNRSLENEDFAPGGDYDFENLPVGVQMPSINPTGALVALTKSIVRGKMKDDEVVVVADVFGDGIARIAEIVKPPRDARALSDLEKALSGVPPAEAPFVPANQDNRSNVVRVILKIQRVDVIEKTARPKAKS